MLGKNKALEAMKDLEASLHKIYNFMPGKKSRKQTNVREIVATYLQKIFPRPQICKECLQINNKTFPEKICKEHEQTSIERLELDQNGQNL